MGILDNIKSFVHSITTEDHYASFDSPYKNSTLSSGSNGGGANSSSNSRLQELGRLAGGNSSSQSLTSSRNNSTTNVVGYRPGLRSSSTNLNGSDLQLQNLNASGQPPLPSIDSLWNRIENWVDEEYPELGDNLNYGVTTADLNEFENDISCGSLPVEFRQFYKIHDGQMRGGEPTGLILGLVLLDIESIAEEYRIWGKVAVRLEKQQYIMQHQSNIPGSSSGGPSGVSSSASATVNKSNPLNNNFLANQKSLPPQAIQCVYSHKGWIPFIKDDGGNQIAIDLAPGPSGSWGQIIIFGRDFDTKVVIASSFQEFIFNFVTDLENGNFQIDQDESNESMGYLEISRNDDDYMIGAEEEGQGELNFYDRSGKEFGKVKGKLSYIEVWKRRALKKFGITNIDQFSTTFVPHRMKKTTVPGPNPVASSSVSPAENKIIGTPRTASPSVLPKVSSPLINMESSSKIALAKETLIDETEAPKEEAKESAKEEPKEAEAEVEEATEPEAKKDDEEAEEASESVSEVAEGLKEVAL